MAGLLPEEELIAFIREKTQEMRRSECSACCPDCLVIISRALCDGQARTRASRPACHEFWDSCISTATRTWTDEEICALREELRGKVAACPTRALPIHRYDVVNLGDPSDPVQKFFHALYQCLAYNIVPAPGGHSSLLSSSGPKRMFGGRRSRWPLHPNDLIPFGARQSTEMHVHWCCRFISPAPFTVLMVLLFSCRPIILPHLLESPLREHLLWCTVQMLHADTGCDIFPWPASVTYSRPDRLPHWFLTSSTSTNASVGSAVWLLRALLSGPDAGSDDLANFFGSYEAALMPAVYSALDMQQSGAISLDRGGCTVLCRIAVHLRDHSPRVELHPLVRAWQQEQSSPDDASWIASLHAHLDGCYRRRTCCGPGCTRGIHDTEDGKPLSLCAGCKFTQYCSGACQRADWKHEAWPHKRLCGILRLFVPFLKSKSSEFEEAFYALDLDYSEDSDYDLMLLWLGAE